MANTITIEDIQAAAARIDAHRTPVLTSTAINTIASENSGSPMELFFKCELLQKTGSFKIRGATNAVQLLTDADASKGVVTHSSGNHAQALACAARMRGIPAYVVMPNNSPQVKKAAVKGYGATVIECEATQEEREKTAKKVQEETGATFIHPFNNPHVIAGQGTISLELLAQEQQLDALVIPVGGGGMLSGNTIATKALSPQTFVFAAEPLEVNDTYRSYTTKGRVANTVGARSVADGLLTNLGEIAFSVVIKNVDGVFVVTEREIIQAMELIWGRMKLCIEPSAAVGVAVVLYNKEFHARVKKEQIRKIGVILCGGNVDLVTAASLFEQI
ncbi:tryptophan synthase beta subunit-like PLP-dependent enzyme [Phascolomyces articulosus]|uniref:Tryptophan synthase beta subunit-like PLP-dependent enzyme n=1 Tax=Phascolomyces articulosus TaxID=60185 RepID=A0AAD5K5W3_9FUNG|nr:tryptophan synthase beta subunit-like PLP-dependent enzyme [Phascolomyces articulosus]